MVALKTIFAFATAGLFASVRATCNVGGCISAIYAGNIAVVGACAAAEFTLGALIPADIACIAAITADAVGAIGACHGCALAANCDPSDQTAAKNGCSQLGPNKCLQLSSSVPKPSKTDHQLGDYTFHCHNTALIVDKTGATCVYPCTNCTQCAGTPKDAKREIEPVFDPVNLVA